MNTRVLFVALCTALNFFSSANAVAQEKTEVAIEKNLKTPDPKLVTETTSPKVLEQENPNAIYSEVEVVPQFPGGHDELIKFVYKNFEAQIRVVMNTSIGTSFVVEKDGTLSDIKIIRDPGFKVGKEILRILKKSPKWKPGLVNGKPVRTLHTMSIAIRLK